MRGQLCYVTAGQACVMYRAWNPKDNYDMSGVYLLSNLMALCHSKVSLVLSTDINITETTYSCQF